MPDVKYPIEAGHFARRQIYSREPRIAWNHLRRLRSGLALARPFAHGRVLDYGCGDGTFLGLLQSCETPPALAVGADIDPRVVNDCQRQFAAWPCLRFVNVAALGRDHEGSFDAIFCMEVLEHVLNPAPLLAEFERLLKPFGTLVISVPIETGFPLLVKQVVRTVAGWRSIGDDSGTSRYNPRELLTSVFASSRRQHLVRPVFHRGDGGVFHDHKGFNWRALRSMVASRFDLMSTVTSPFAWAGPQLSAQVWFVARQR